MEETNYLQSPHWANFNERLGRQVISKHTDDYSFIAIIEKGQLSNRLYCPLGPVAKDIKSFKKALTELKKIARQHKLDFVRVEPTFTISAEQMRGLGFKPASRDVQPSHTVVNRVDESIEQIEATLSQTARRYARKCDKAGITYRVSYEPAEIKHFLKLINQVAARTGMRPHDDFYFQQIAGLLFPTKSAGLMFAELDGEVIASIIFYTDGTTMYYAHAANSTEHRKYSPATGLGLFALKFAHESGCKYFDWFGVAPEDAGDNPRWAKWAGFTQFKLSYGGDRVNRVGTWELPIRRLRYSAYRLLLAISHR